MTRIAMVLCLICLPLTIACGGNEADELGVGAECTANDQCDSETDQICLTNFTGGYCGIRDCTGDDECPSGAACVSDVGGGNFCFRICLEKVECNANRSVENESNCSANVTFVDGAQGRKACLPPSSGT